MCRMLSVTLSMTDERGDRHTLHVCNYVPPVGRYSISSSMPTGKKSLTPTERNHMRKSSKENLATHISHGKMQDIIYACDLFHRLQKTKSHNDYQQNLRVCLTMSLRKTSPNNSWMHVQCHKVRYLIAASPQNFPLTSLSAYHDSFNKYSSTPSVSSAPELPFPSAHSHIHITHRTSRISMTI